MSRWHCATVAGERRPPRAVIHSCTPRWSIFPIGHSPHFATTWFCMIDMIDASRAPAGQSPVLHLRRLPGGRMWDHYMRSFEEVWKIGEPAT